jgi:hypothetical protein
VSAAGRLADSVGLLNPPAGGPPVASVASLAARRAGALWAGGPSPLRRFATKAGEKCGPGVSVPTITEGIGKGRRFIDRMGWTVDTLIE